MVDFLIDFISSAKELIFKRKTTMIAKSKCIVGFIRQEILVLDLVLFFYFNIILYKIYRSFNKEPFELYSF
jgi:hypothetical protein